MVPKKAPKVKETGEMQWMMVDDEWTTDDVTFASFGCCGEQNGTVVEYELRSCRVECTMVALD